MRLDIDSKQRKKLIEADDPFRSADPEEVKRREAAIPKLEDVIVAKAKEVLEHIISAQNIIQSMNDAVDDEDEGDAGSISDIVRKYESRFNNAKSFLDEPRYQLEVLLNLIEQEGEDDDGYRAY